MNVYEKISINLFIYINILTTISSIPGFIKKLGKIKDLSPNVNITVGEVIFTPYKNDKFSCSCDQHVSTLRVGQKAKDGI